MRPGALTRNDPEEQAGQDNGADVCEDEPMRMLVLLASFAAVIGLAAPAQADPPGTESGPDAGFLTALDNAGITYQSRTGAVAAGKKACQLMDQGYPDSDVINSVSASNPGFAMDAATKFTAIAASAYCPQHLGDPTTPPPPPPPASAFIPDLSLPALPAA
ncbi:DUF732 domain-containing protein [Mycobacterium sp. 663a-19]|uniref:DUF732 domain-containing protein n=1 Tax=Mycobacterium sp. 663a-19 TaxID=2986148 RepID=UPI002D1EBC0E|nr:DUF732 domain-containing protein [Mycobacterium sp. 663a-19]MEB3982017.1 DUF732 domain-containing protein [Mycobacterium sp. 663a-19]